MNIYERPWYRRLAAEQRNGRRRPVWFLRLVVIIFWMGLGAGVALAMLPLFPSDLMEWVEKSQALVLDWSPR